MCPTEEKWRRFRLLEELQEKIAAEINARYLGRQVEVLFEEKVRGAGAGARRPISWSSSNPMKICAARFEKSRSPGLAPGRCRQPACQACQESQIILITCHEHPQWTEALVGTAWISQTFLMRSLRMNGGVFKPLSSR